MAGVLVARHGDKRSTEVGPMGMTGVIDGPVGPLNELSRGTPPPPPPTPRQGGLGL